MARRSLVEQHPQRDEIDRDLRAGVPGLAVAARSGFQSFSSVARYRRRLLARDEERRERDTNLTETDRLARRLDSLWSLLAGHLVNVNTAASPKLDKNTLEVIKEARATVREIANVRGLLRPQVQIGVGVNVNTSNDNAQNGTNDVPADEVKAALFRGLRGHPEARDSVVAEFERLQRRYDVQVVDAEVEHAD